MGGFHHETTEPRRDHREHVPWVDIVVVYDEKAPLKKRQEGDGLRESFQCNSHNLIGEWEKWIQLAIQWIGWSRV
jgi:hypothetical protein